MISSFSARNLSNLSCPIPYSAITGFSIESRMANVSVSYLILDRFKSPVGGELKFCKLLVISTRVGSPVLSV